LVEHHVLAYVCSHVIAYDVRLREGVLQICSGGAGTRYGPTGDFMRGNSEFFHFLVCSLDNSGLYCEAIDEKGVRCRRLRWPTETPTDASDGFARRGTKVTPDLLVPSRLGLLRFDIVTAGPDEAGIADRETILCGFDADEGPPTVWIGREGERLATEILLWPGGPVGRWTLGSFPDFQRFGLEVVPDLGPGGILFVPNNGCRSSLWSNVAEDLDRIRWPRHWRLGHGPSGPTDEPFRGRVDATCLAIDRTAPDDACG